LKSSVIAIAMLGLAASPAAAQEPGIGLELNKLEPADRACRAYLVTENRTARAFTSLNLDLVMFGPDGVIARRLAVETAPLPADKTTVKAFNIAGLDCGAIGRVLLNGVLACEDAQGERDDCLAMLDTAAKGELSFVK